MLLLFSCAVVPHCLCHPGLKHARPPSPSLSPGIFSNLCPLSWWCHSTISSSITPFSACHESFPASESLPMSRIFNSGGKSFGASASASVLPINIQGWLPSGLTGLISLLYKGLSRVFSSTTVQKHQFFGTHNKFNDCHKFNFSFTVTKKKIPNSLLVNSPWPMIVLEGLSIPTNSTTSNHSFLSLLQVYPFQYILFN